MRNQKLDVLRRDIFPLLFPLKTATTSSCSALLLVHNSYSIFYPNNGVKLEQALRNWKHCSIFTPSTNFYMG